MKLNYFLLLECQCNAGGTENTNRCDQDTGLCSCKDGWYGHLCLYGKSKKSNYNMQSVCNLSKSALQKRSIDIFLQSSKG